MLSVRCESSEARNTLLREPNNDEREPDFALLYMLWRPTVREVLEDDFFLLKLERPPAMTRRTIRARLAASPATRELFGPVAARVLICVELLLSERSRRESLCLLASLGERRGTAALTGEAAALAAAFSCVVQLLAR